MGKVPEGGCRRGWAFVVSAWLSLIPLGVGATERDPLCIRISTQSDDPMFETTLRVQLENELGIDVVAEDESSCSPLFVEIQGRTAIISFPENDYATTIRLIDVPSAHWPRAVALSAAGLFAVLRRPPSKPSTEAPADPDRRIDGDSGGPRDTAAARTTAPESSDNTPKGRASSLHRVRLGVHAGARIMPRYPFAVGEVGVGLARYFGSFYPTISLMGIGGQRSVALGRIVAAGIGVRLAGYWSSSSRQSGLRVRLGAAADVFGVWGIGLKKGTSDKTAFAPVVDLLALVGISFSAGARSRIGLLVGGGGTILYYRMMANQESEAGLSGGLVTACLEVSFGL